MNVLTAIDTAQALITSLENSRHQETDIDRYCHGAVKKTDRFSRIPFCYV